MFIFCFYVFCIYYLFKHPDKPLILLLPLLAIALIYFATRRPHLIVYCIVFLIPLQSLRLLSYKHYSLHIVNLMIGALFAITLFKRIIMRERILTQTTGWIFSYLLFIIIFTVVFSQNVYETFYSSLFIDLVFSMLLVTILHWHIVDYKQLGHLILVILCSSIVQTGLAYLQFFGMEPFYVSGHHNPTLFMGNVGIPVGTFPGPGKFAEYILLAFCLVIGTWFNKKYLNRTVGMILMAMFFFIVIMSGSRTISASMVVAPVLMLLLLRRKGALDLPNVMKKSILLVLVMTVLLVVVIQYLPETATQRIATKITGEKATDKDIGPLGVRSAINKAAIDMFLDNPVAGIGYGKFSEYSAPYVSRYAFIPAHQYQDWEAHNMYAMVLVDGGLGGFILFVGILISGFMNFRVAFRWAPDSNHINVIMIASFFIYYIFQLFNMYVGYGLYFHLMLVLGISVALKNITLGNYSDKAVLNRIHTRI